MGIIKKFKSFFSRDKKLPMVIDESLLDDLKDIFIEFCDEFDYEINRLYGCYYLECKDLLTLSRNKGSMTYGIHHIFDPEEGLDFDYIFFILFVTKDVVESDEYRRILDLSNQISNRVKSMGFKCKLQQRGDYYRVIANQYQSPGDNFIQFRIGFDDNIENDDIFYKMRNSGKKSITVRI